MYINTGVGRGWSGDKVSIDTYRDTRIELVIYEKVNYAGGCHWISVSLSPAQAIKVAHRLQNPLPDTWVDFADPDSGGRVPRNVGCNDRQTR